MTDAKLPLIVGYIVFTDDIETAALYPISKRTDAYDAAIRWKACISAVVMHPDAPSVDVAIRSAELPE